MQPDFLLRIPHLLVQNANTISSPQTWGFPSPTALTGLVDALTRWSRTELGVEVIGASAICHGFAPQVSKPPGKYHYVFCLTRNPVGKDGVPETLVEEGRAHLEMSLVLGLAGEGLFNGARSLDEIAEQLAEQVRSMRFAGGSILPAGAGKRFKPEMLSAQSDSTAKETKRFVRSLLPGFALVGREKVLSSHTQRLHEADPNNTSLEALLDFCRINHECKADPEDPAKGIWSIRKKPGWFVPIPAGYRAISEIYDPGIVKNTRDRVTPFRFVESILTLGQWISPHRAEHPKDLLWTTQVDLNQGLYRCTTPHYATQELPASKEG